MKKKRTVFTAILLSLLAASLVLTGCETKPVDPTSSTLQTVQPQAKGATNLMEHVQPQTVTKTDVLSADFVTATADFSVKLFQNSRDAEKNSLISPTSAVLALGMASNGAAEQTANQFLQVLGNGKLTQEQLNQSYATLLSRFQSDKKIGKLLMVNSIWYHNQNLTVQPDFLQTNADYFGINAYQINFQDSRTTKRINDWVNENTGGKINRIVGQIHPEDLMYLINTIFFEMDWNHEFLAQNTKDRDFHMQNGKTLSVPFMSSHETYLENGTAHGMKKSYQDPRYSFVAIIPKDGTSLSDCIQSLTGQAWLDLVNHPVEDINLTVDIPKFQYTFDVSLKESLEVMGLTDSFSPQKANFSNMGSSSIGNLYINQVIQKTYIEVDELGTRAGAATLVGYVGAGAPSDKDRHITFDHPFLYGILDKETGLPLFLGTVMNPKT